MQKGHLAEGDSHQRYVFIQADPGFSVYLGRFNGLSRVSDAAYNSSARVEATGCLPDTRVAVLQNIYGWAISGGPPLYWLCGMAGTGKTTIANSIAEEYDRKKLLGASFFFSRDQQERRESRFLIQTIAYQLGNSFPVLKLAIANILEDQRITTANLQSQLKRLILEPVAEKIAHLPSLIMIVLDALDECEEDHAVIQIIELFVQVLRGQSLPLRIFITSRPESHIRSTFLMSEVQSNTRSFILHEIKLSDVQQDIDKFVRHKLTHIATYQSEIVNQKPWPKEAEILALVEMAAGLFIAAATMLKFISPDRRTRDLKSRLALILSDPKEASRVWPSHPFQSLDNLYAKILEHATIGDKPTYVFERFRTIVGMVILSFSCLTIQELERLLQNPGQVVMALGELHSIVHVSKGGGPIRALHASLHDYLTDKSRCRDPRFFIDPSVQHAEIARHCLERMKPPSLRRDICDIGDYSKLNEQVDDLKRRKEEHIPGDLQYACRYWASHFSSADVGEGLIDLVRSFAFVSILHWMEVLSLVGELNGGLRSLRSAQEKLAVRFLVTFRCVPSHVA